MAFLLPSLASCSVLSSSARIITVRVTRHRARAQSPEGPRDASVRPPCGTCHSHHTTFFSRSGVSSPPIHRQRQKPNARNRASQRVHILNPSFFSLRQLGFHSAQKIPFRHLRRSCRPAAAYAICCARTQSHPPLLSLFPLSRCLHSGRALSVRIAALHTRRFCEGESRTQCVGYQIGLHLVLPERPSRFAIMWCSASIYDGVLGRQVAPDLVRQRWFFPVW
jgi:hypothetical protein